MRFPLWLIDREDEQIDTRSAWARRGGGARAPRPAGLCAMQLLTIGRRTEKRSRPSASRQRAGIRPCAPDADDVRTLVAQRHAVDDEIGVTPR